MIEQEPYAGRTSLRVAQKPDQHRREEHHVDGQNRAGAEQAGVRVQGDAGPNNRVVRGLELFFKDTTDSAPANMAIRRVSHSHHREGYEHKKKRT